LRLSETSVNIIGIIVNTWQGFHIVRRKHGLWIADCYILFGCVWLESIDRDITEGSMRPLMKAYHNSYIHRLFLRLLDKGYIVLTRTEGRKHFYSLTNEGRNISALLLEGIEARQVAFFNKYLK
jgi:hypothetical protein